MNKGKEQSKRNKLKALIEILLFCICCIIFIYIRNDTFFYPRNDISSYQQLKNYDEFEEINITDNDTTLNWWIHYDNSKTEATPLIIYFGGNAENSSNTMFDFFNQWIFNQLEWFNFLMIDYPWYWYSKWTPSKKSIFNACDIIYQRIHIQPDINKNNIIIIGYSFWTKVAIHYASKHNIKWLILIAPDEVAPYNKNNNFYKKILNIFYAPMKWFSKNKLKLLLNTKNINIEPQVITSYNDKIVTYILGKSNNSQKYETILDKNIEHSEYFYQDEVLHAIEAYLNKTKK